MNLCKSNNVLQWKEHSVDLRAFVGQTINLQIRAETNGALNSSFFVDDVTLNSSVLKTIASGEEADHEGRNAISQSPIPVNKPEQLFSGIQAATKEVDIEADEVRQIALTLERVK